MHGSSCGCPDCSKFHPERFKDAGAPTANGRIIWYPRHGLLNVVERSATMVRVSPNGEEDAFWLTRVEVERYNRPPTPEHLRPTRAPVASDLPWQAYLRARAHITVNVWEGHVCRVLDMIERTSGVRYAPDDTGIVKLPDKNDQWSPSFHVLWTGEVPEDFPYKARRYVFLDKSHKKRQELGSNPLALELLGLGFPFGWGR